MPTRKPSFQRCSRQNTVATAVPVHSQFRMRLLTMAVLSACASLSLAAQNHAAAPVNPLPTGGVVSDPSSASIVNSTPNLMQINQTAAKTTIRWNSFDIGQGYTVRFNQPSSLAEAMNYIGGANPSVIQGTLSANGKVYLVNSNGILFDGTAQVNVNTLIASSLDISQSTFDNGITSNLVGKTDPTLVATMVLNTAGQVINYGTIKSVKVDGASGQVVNNPTTGKPVEEGGTIMLFAPQVENHGVITANNGQVILAAGKSVYLQLYNDPTGADYNPNDLSMRGFLVKVTAAPDGALNLSQLIAAQKLNSVANLGGEIHTDRGNTTLTGLVVNQSGLVSANTATTVNGSIWLKAENYDAASKQTTYANSVLTTSKDSVTQTLPENDGTTLAESDPYADNTVYNTGSFPHYQAVIKMTGETVVHEGQAVAPGGRIVIGKENVNNDPTSRPSQTGRVYLGTDSVLSTAGLWVDLPYESNYLTFKLGSLDLADSPLQKDGFLINQTVTVDTRKGSPLLFSIADKVAAMPRSVSEKATAGGTITVNTGEFISAGNASVDVSGGGYRYGDGTRTTTYLVSHGRLYDVATAPTTLQYDGVVNKTALVKGYVEGKGAGLLTIDAQQMALGGQFAGGVTVGPYQRAMNAMPEAGRLVLGTQSVLAGSALDFSSVKDGTTANNLDSLGSVYALHDVTFGEGTAARQQIADALAGVNADPLNAAFPTDLTDTLLLPANLFGGMASGNAQSNASTGFGALALRASGTITVPQDVTLDLGAGGSLMWLAPQIDVAGTVRAADGALAFNRTVDNSLYGTTHLGVHGILSVAGNWINDSASTGGVVVPNAVDGGTVTIKGYATMAAGSTIDASGGARLDQAGKLSYGNGGTIALPTTELDGVNLQAYGGTHGGTLALAADAIDVGGPSADALLPGFFTQGGFTQYTLEGLNAVHFRESLHPVAYQRIARANAQLAPTGTPFSTLSSVQTTMSDYLRSPVSLNASTGASSSGTFQLGVNETGITVDPGVTLRMDPRGSISLSSATRMDIGGTLIAPGGAISLTLDSGSKFYYDTATGRFNALNIGDQAVLSTAGVFLADSGPRGLVTGQVLHGGTIDITARKNDLVMGKGAVIDVSGAKHAADMRSGTGNAIYTRATVASEGGRVAINATENAYLDATFLGAGGDASVAGGSFALDLSYHGALTSNAIYGNLLAGEANNDAKVATALAYWDADVHQLEHTIVVSQTATSLLHDGSSADSSVIGNLSDGNGRFVSALRANISADQLVNGVEKDGVHVGGGFDTVSLKADSQIQLIAGLNNFAPRAQLRLDTPELRVQGAGAVSIGNGTRGGNVWQTGQIDVYNTQNAFRLSTNLPADVVAQYPTLSNLLPQVPVATQPGRGELSLNAGQISLAGNIAAKGVANLKLISSGDIRFEGFPLGYLDQNDQSDSTPLLKTLLALTGRLSSAGNITLQADQIYPATAVDYSVAVEQASVDSITQDAQGNIAVSTSRNPVADGLITVKGNDTHQPAPVLSAGGRLTLKADQILQGGTIKAPLGQIALEGGKSLTLQDGSVTSVSALWQHDGGETELVIPYGATRNVGQSLWYGSRQTETAPSKQISATADAVSVASGATLDIRGGGDFAAMEWIPGIGGSKDVLAAANTYAIIPGVLFQPGDGYLNGLAPVGVNAGAPYTMVHLAAGAGLPEGDYALLPAYYALLPGAYLVKAQSAAGYTNLNPGYAATQADGSVIVAGRLGYAGTGIRQSVWSGFSVQSGADALTQTSYPQAEYLVTGSQYFVDQAAKNNTSLPALPQDGGRLSIGARGNLAFEGTLLAQAGMRDALGQYGANGQVDIYGAKFAIVDNAAAAPSGYTSLKADDLSRLGADLLIGGKRTDTANGQTLDVIASDVLVDLDGGTLRTPEMWLAATDTLNVTGRSTLEASGTVVSRSGTLKVNVNPDGGQYGALLGLSAAELAPIVRTGALDTDPAHGNLDIAAGAKLSAKGGSVVIDSTGTPHMAAVAESDTLAIGARQIALGAVPQSSTALTLGNAQLAALGSARNFVLRSYSSIDFYGAVNLGQTGGGSFTLDSAGLVGHAVNGTGAAVQLSAGQLTLQNLSGSAYTGSGSGAGSLTLNADRLVLGDSVTSGGLNDGGVTVAGFSQADLNAGEVSLQGRGLLTVAGDLNIESARVAAAGQQADQRIKAYDADNQTWHAIKLTRPANAPVLADAPAPGGKLALDGSSIDFDGNVTLESGRLAFAAHGGTVSDGVTLRSGSNIDLSAYEKTFAQGTADIVASASAGRLTLSSDHGSVDAQSGSRIDLQGGATSGDAGVLTINAAHGTVNLNGTLLASAAGGQRAGSVYLDTASLANFSILNAALENGGFGLSRYLRARTGDIEVATVDTATARNIQLVADAGDIAVKGILDASGVEGGGKVELDAGQGIHLHGGSRILANGTSAGTGADAAYSDGGEVALYAHNGQLAFDNGAVIDVSAAAAGKSSGGGIVFSAPRTAGGNGLLATLAGQVKSTGGTVSVTGGRAPQPGTVVLEGYKRYTGIATTSSAASTSGAVYADYDAFMNAADSIQGAALTALQAGGSDVTINTLKVRAGMELVSSGDMTVDADWDLTNADWLRTSSSQTAGRLALRAAGNIDVNARLGLPNESALPPDSGWTLELAGGADTAAADVLAVTPSTTAGDVVLNTDGKLTSSTGDIRIAAGRDVRATTPASVVYTTGRAVALPIMAADPALNKKYFAPASGVNFVDGGSISIDAKRDVTGSGGYANVNDWLRRNTVVPGTTLNSSVSVARGYAYQPAYWWVDRLGNTTAKTKGIEGIATLGGGNIAITASNTISNLSVASATSRSASTSATLVTVNGRNTIPSANAVYGGGDVRIDAGSDLLGGQYLVGRGRARFTAGGDIGGLNGVADSATAPAFWLMGWSDDPAWRGAHVDVEALGGVTLGSAANPTITSSPKNAGATVSNTHLGYRGTPSYFFNYAPEDTLSLTAVGGNLVIVPVTESARNILPPRFSAAALEGSVSSGTGRFDASNALMVGGSNGLAQLPDSNGLFRLLAGDTVHDLVLRAGDYAPANLGTANSLVLGISDFIALGKSYAFNPPLVSDPRMVTPSGLPGYRYAVVAETGDVSDAAFYFPQKSVVRAGRDIANVQLDLQNLGDDISRVAAGRDVLYSNVLDNGTQWGLMPHIQIGGPGKLLVEAGRNVNLGAVNATKFSGSVLDSNDVTRIDAVGNTTNSSLQTAGAASLIVMSGVDTGLLSTEQVDGLFSVLRSVGQFQGLLGQVQSNAKSTEAAVAEANAVIQEANQAIDVLFAGAVQPGSRVVYEAPIDPNAAAGRSATGLMTDAYNGALVAANNAIAALFKAGRTGDITLYNARVSTGTNPGATGGDINLLAPNGNINVGLPTASSGRNIGIYTTSGGAINAYLSGDMNVNLSKVATFQGGDIVLYTSGDGSTLDAGRGSRSARTSSPPRLVAELKADGTPTGKLLLLPPLDVSGSGIRTVSYDPDGFGPLRQPDPGKVYLLAPTGTIDAGEAGVSSASGLVVAALVVKNADNFSASGSSVGVPSVSSGVPAAPVSGDAAASASKAMDAMAQANNALASEKDADIKSFRPSFVTVEVLGFGGESAECGKDDALCRKQKNGGT